MEEELRAGEESDGEGGSHWGHTEVTLGSYRGDTGAALGSNAPLLSVLCWTLCSASDWLQCAFLEASNCQVESRYLGILRQLQETKSLDPAQQGAVQNMIEDALKGELKSVVKLNVTR